MELADLPTLNAGLNALSGFFLSLGYLCIRQGRSTSHKRWMLAALTSSALFLFFYLIYHYQVGSVPYPHHDWTRPLYFAILIPHIILAAAMVPFILLAVWHALHNRFDKHKRLTRWVWPTWMFVSISGIAIYLMLYCL